MTDKKTPKDGSIEVSTLDPEDIDVEELKKQKRSKVNFEVSAMLEDQDEEDNEEDVNERYRSEEQEKKQEKEQEVEEQKSFEEQIQEHKEGYDRDAEISFDPLTHEKETEKEVEQEYELEHALTDDDVKKEEEKQRKLHRKAWKGKQTAASKETEATLKKTEIIRQVQKSQKDVQKGVENVSAYRHHSKVRPGDQAGIFDNQEVKAEKEFEQIEKEIKKKSSGLSWESGVEIVEAKDITGPGQSPHVQSLEQQKGKDDGGRGV